MILQVEQIELPADLELISKSTKRFLEDWFADERTRKTFEVNADICGK